MNIRSEIAKRVGVAITLSSFWPLYNTGTRVLAVVVIAALIWSCVVLGLSNSNRLPQPRWKKLVEASMIELTFTALGLGMVTSGLRLLISGAIWLGIGTVLAGAFFLGTST